MHDIELEQDIFVFTKIITTRNSVWALLAIQHPVPAEAEHGPAQLSPQLLYFIICTSTQTRPKKKFRFPKYRFGKPIALENRGHK